MGATSRRDELKQFLRTRRQALRPEALGLRSAGRRRTPGLRREEVAALADVGVTWYTWLEQGRDIRVSREVLDRIAHALRLAPTDIAYLFKLADLERDDDAVGLAEIDPRIQLTLDAISGCPAFVMNARFDVLAWNRLADRVFKFDDYEGPFAHNHMWRSFMDPRRRAIYGDWDALVPGSVGVLRAHYATRIGDPAFEELIDALRKGSPDFERMWTAQVTSPLQQTVAVTLVPPKLGKLNVYSTRFAIAERPGSMLFILAPADDATRNAFAHVPTGRRLDSRRAGR